MRSRRSAWPVLVLACLAVVVLAACATIEEDDQSSAPTTNALTLSQGCDEAFRDAAEVSASQRDPEDLNPAVRACGSFEEWISGSEKHPDALGGIPPLLFLRNTCQFSFALAGAPLCELAQFND